MLARRRRPSSLSCARALLPVLGLLLAVGCGRPADSARMEERLDELEERFTPGLHTLMRELGARHATLWFAGEAGNWALADYQLHEIEELIEDIETLHPVYDQIPVAALMQEMTAPAMDELARAVDENDREGFTRTYDRLTLSCNACHVASDRGMLRIVRPTAPPITNLDFAP